jgi:uncharacterized repeat protein (TIGR03803 family)
MKLKTIPFTIATTLLAARPRTSYLLASFVLAGWLATNVSAQTLTALKSFSSGDGALPYGELLLSGSTLYGTTENGGSANSGTVFKVNADGSGFTNLYSFTGGYDGANPYAGLVLSGNTLYGTAYSGGSSDLGTVFAINTDGSGFTNLYSFTGGLDCGNPYAGLILSGGKLYGTTTGLSSAIAYYGSVFSINTDGSGFTVLKTFEGGDGANPYGALALSGGMIYGTTASGTPGYGTIFKVSTSGSGFTTLHSFTDGTDGGAPYGELLLSGSTLYGTTSQGGAGYGIIFRASTSNNGFAIIHTFNGNDGAYPQAGLILSGTTLYGAVNSGGSSGYGMVFQINPVGGAFTNLYSFTDGSDGAYPNSGLTFSGNTLFGVAAGGGNFGYGTVFALTLFGPPVITNQPMSQIVLVGSTNSVTFSVGVVGTAPLAYQWALNNVALPGATNATLTVTNVSLADSGSAYSVLVTNTYFNAQLQIFTNGSVLSSTALLTVLPALAITQPASSITTTGAVLNGSVTVGSDETVAWFEWGTDTNYGNIAGTAIVPGNNGSNNITTALGGLSPGEIYHFRFDAANDFGIVYGNDQSFVPGLPPTVTNLPVTNVGTNDATFNATINPEGPDTVAYFRWGTSTSYGNLTSKVDMGSGITPMNFDFPITNILSASFVYHVQAVASNSLGVTFGSDVTFILGPWVSTIVPIHNWDAIASSADGTKLVAVAYDLGTGGIYTGGPIYTSTNSGATWISNSLPVGQWESVACSADGTELVVAGGGGGHALGPIYLSTNSGAIWTPTSAPSNNWYSVASSADGTKLAAVDGGGQRIYTSPDSGNTWTNTSAPSNYWYSVASSADGTKLVAVAGLYSHIGPIYTSTNSGATWSSNSAPHLLWTHVSSSADGITMMAVAGGTGSDGPIYTSTNSGATWVLRSGAGIRPWISSAVSADGTKMAAVVQGGINGIYTSTNSGVTWVVNQMPFLDWNAVASSADGSFLVASVGYPATGGIYRLQTTPSPVLNLFASENGTIISWIIPSLDFTLQQSPDLMTWTDVTNLPALNLTNLQNQVTLPPTDGNSFFRLMH